MSDVMTISVANSAELIDALRSVRGGETIKLQAGVTYNVERLFPIKPNAEVVITSEDPARPAIIDTLRLQGAQNLTFEHILFDSRPSATREKTVSKLLEVTNTTNISIKNSDFISSAEGYFGGDAPYVGGGSVGSVQFSNNFTFSGNTVSNFFHGIVFVDDVSNIRVIDNLFQNLQGDALRAGDIQNYLIQGNEFRNELGSRQDINHTDMIQIWRNAGDSPVKNVTIVDNFFNAGVGAWTESIFIQNNGGRVDGLPNENIVIKNNLIYNGHLHGITVYHADGVVIANNTVLLNPQVAVKGAEAPFENIDIPAINVFEGSTNVTVTNNVAGSIGLRVPATSSGNVLIDFNDPTAPNYVGKVFPFIGEGGELPRWAFVTAPGDTLVGPGVGAEGTRFDMKPDGVAALFTMRQSSTEPGLVSFDASASVGPGGLLVNADPGAQYRWIFSDGGVATGRSATHVFDGYGAHWARLEITTSAGQTASLTRLATVEDPLLLRFEFDGGVADDLSAYDSAVRGLSVPGVDGTRGEGYALTDTNDIVVERSNTHLYSLESFSFAFSLKRGALNDGDGKILMIHNSLWLDLRSDGELAFSLAGSTGVVHTATTTGARMTTTDWRHVVVSYDGDAQRLELYVDGALRGSTFASGSTRPVESWPLVIGNPWGANFNGVIDGFTFSAKAMTAAGVAAAAKEALGAAAVDESAGQQSGEVTAPAAALTPLQPGVQDFGTATLDPGGSTMTIKGNAWKQLLTDVTITENTVLYVDFTAPVVGEIQGIGFANGEALAPQSFLQLTGTQLWGLQPEIETGSGALRIEVGKLFTGDFDRIVFANDDDASGRGVSRFGDIRLVEETPQVAQNVQKLFAPTPSTLQSWASGSQDFGTATAIDGGVKLAGNAWKAIAADIVVTQDTVLYVDFSAPVLGEIHGIGFETDEALSPETFLQFAGTQPWGAHDLGEVYDGGVQTLRIAVGERFTGAFDRLVLVADDDARMAGVSTFANLRLVEEKDAATVSVETLNLSAADLF